MVLAESSSKSSSSIGATVGFAFRFVEGFAADNRGSLEAEGALLGAERAGGGGGPCGGSKAPKAEAGCWNNIQ